MLTLLLIALAAGPPVTVQGDCTCPAPAAATAGTVAFVLGGALSGSLAPGGGGAGGALGALLVGSVTSDRLGGRLALQAGTERTTDLGTGTVRWRRLAAALGPQLRFKPAGGRLFLDLHVEATGAWVLAGGTGFSTHRQDSSAAVGVGPGLRLLFARRARTPWGALSPRACRAPRRVY